MSFQIVQVVAALLILVAFALNQFNRLQQHSRAYLVLNAAGSGVLAVQAWVQGQWGFVLLEGVWSGISTVNLLRTFR